MSAGGSFYYRVRRFYHAQVYTADAGTAYSGKPHTGLYRSFYREPDLAAGYYYIVLEIK
jgi:hypothetical protein